MSDDLVSKDRLIFSFTLTYVLLLTTGTVTLIEALRTKIPLVRHIFNLETVISVIAGYFYSKFVDRIKESFAEGKQIDWQEIIKTRYLDWAITTPLMLMVLINVIAHHNKRSPSIRIYFLIISLNRKIYFLSSRENRFYLLSLKNYVFKTELYDVILGIQRGIYKAEYFVLYWVIFSILCNVRANIFLVC